jgi:diguanylate cyclase (GGDEF)-like protein/PAS domain S-box-containing protein
LPIPLAHYPMRSETAHRDPTVEHAADALLREHPDALVCALSTNGLIVPVPGSLPLLGQAAIEGRAVIDGVVAADRGEVISLWNRLDEELAVNGKVRLLSKPTRWVTLHFLDLRAAHGVRLCVVLPSDEPAPKGEEAEEVAAFPRFATLLEDEGAKVIECDDAFTQMFGYTQEELLGESVLDQIHPDDQGRAVEGWLTMLSTRRDQLTRLRRRRKDGSWVWVDTTLHNYLNRPDRDYVLVELIDVTAEMAAQEALEEREELLRRITDAMPIGLMQVDTDRNAVYHNGRLEQILHAADPSHERSAPDAPSSDAPESPEPDLAGPLASADPDLPSPAARELLSTLTKESLARFEAALGYALEQGLDEDVEVDIVLAGGEWRRALMSIRALRRASGEISGAIASVLDVTDSARAHEELERRATFDALTGAHNRAAILDMLQAELDRDDDSVTGVVFVDLDKFKPVNDAHGHAAGDELLVLVAERLRELARREDGVGRLGGDEFLLLLPDIRGSDVALRVAERVCSALSGTIELSVGAVELSASVGVACAAGRTTGADELVKRADDAMYRSKKQASGKATLDECSPFAHAAPRDERRATRAG